MLPFTLGLLLLDVCVKDTCDALSALRIENYPNKNRDDTHITERII